MTKRLFEIRLCESCGLRYPLVQEHPHGTRCPVCAGGTRVILSRELLLEPEHDRRPTSSPKEQRDFSVLLDNIRSAWNVGSIFRSADGFGFAHAYLCGITPTPENEAVTKTSLGAEDSVTWSYHKDAVKLVKGLKSEGWKVYALEESTDSVPISQFSADKSPAVLIVGSEVTGVDPDLLALCERVFHIPMRGDKKSYNVAMAFSIAAYAITDRRSS
ncbi:MAG: RNA methyltransferase [Chloroflexi bacterium]|nr:RNA methyltransferase [Chloroflexota bacterium]